MKVRSYKNSGRLPGGLVFAVSAASALVAHADYQSTVLSFNPAGYWRLSESAQVASPPDVITNYGTLGSLGNGYPGPDLTNRLVAGIVGPAITFQNPAASYQYDAYGLIDVPYNPAFNPQGPFSVEFWANPTTVNNDFVATVCSMNVNQSRSGYLMYFDSANNQWMWRIGGTASYAASITSGVNSQARNAWSHVVGVYDGANSLLYVNGVLKAGPTAVTGGAGYNPNNAFPFRIGATSLPNRGFDGQIEQVAVYTNALTADVVAAHYAASTTNNAGYSAQILADNPTGYWPLHDPPYTPPDPTTLPTTANLGYLGALATGTNWPGLTAGVAGPPFSGFGANNLGSRLSGIAGNVDLGDDPGLNNTFTITMMAWVKPATGYGTWVENGLLQNIISHGYVATPAAPASAEVQMRINYGNYETGSWNGTGEGASDTNSYALLDAAAGNWVFLASTFDGANWNLYRYDRLIATGAGTLGALDDSGNWSIGSRGTPTMNGDADTRYLRGAIDEVAIFTNALSLAQIQQIFYSANVLPIIVQAPQPPSGTVYEGSSVSFSVVAEGNKPITYQWTYNNGPIGGQTGTSLALNNLTAGQSGTYAVVVSNPAGSVTSSVPLVVVAGPPVITASPLPTKRFVGATANFSVTAGGTAPLTYQWYQAGTLISGATGSAYSRSNVQLADGTNYNCIVSNPHGSTPSGNALLTVLPAPAALYPSTVLGDNPIAYYRLDETSGTVAYDNWGGHNGTYHGVTLGLPGYSALDADTAAGFTGSDTFVGEIPGIDFSGTTSTFTVEAWVQGAPNQPVNGAAILSKGNGPGGGGVGYQFTLDVTGGFYRFNVEDSSQGAGAGTTVATATVGPDGTWQHVVGTYDQLGGQMIIYVNGAISGSGLPPGLGPRPSVFPLDIGSGQSGNTPVHDQYFDGSIDEVAIYNKALTPDRVQAHYDAQYGPNQAPLIVLQPQAVTQYAGWSASLTAIGAGTHPLSYQWYKGNTAISGATDTTLSFPSLSSSDSANYYVTVSNPVGSSNSVTVALNVLAVPTSPISLSGLVMHLPFDNNLTDATGRGNNGVNHGATFTSPGMLGSSALHVATDTTEPSYDYVSLGTPADLQFGSSVNFSVAYWVRLPANAAPGDLPFLCNAATSTFAPGYTFAPSYKLGGWAWSLNGTGVYGANNSINDGNWHHLVHTFDRAGVGTTYLDGVQVNTTLVAGGATLDTGRPTNIGQDPTGTYGESAAYDLDDMGVWRRILTPLEVTGLYSAGTNGVSFNGPPPGPPGLSFVRSGNSISITFGGTLLSSPTVSGPYNPVSPAPPNPYLVPNTGGTLFFRSVQ